jgi:hypothetical protein
MRCQKQKNIPMHTCTHAHQLHILHPLYSFSCPISCRTTLITFTYPISHLYFPPFIPLSLSLSLSLSVTYSPKHKLSFSASPSFPISYQHPFCIILTLYIRPPSFLHLYPPSLSTLFCPPSFVHPLLSTLFVHPLCSHSHSHTIKHIQPPITNSPDTPSC